MKDVNVIGLICEHIREETGGKHTLIGIFNDTVAVPKFPGKFSRLAVYIRAHLKRGFPLKEFILVIRGIEKEEVVIGSFDPEDLRKAEAQDAGDPAPYLGIVMQAHMQDVPIRDAGRIFVIVRINGEDIIASALKIKLKDSTENPSTVSQQPSGQSPSAS